MGTAKTIAGLIGPTLVVIATSMLLNLGSLPAIAGLIVTAVVVVLALGAFLSFKGYSRD